MASLLLVKLLFVHFVADYLLQFGFLAEGKERNGLRSWHVWVHVALHGVVAQLVLQTWWITLVTLVTHGIIDAAKISFQNPARKRTWFFSDQAMHLAVIGVIWWLGKEAAYPSLPQWLESNLVLVTGLVILTKPSKYMVGVFLTGWTSTSMQRGFPFCGAGPIFGMIERVVTMALILAGWWWIALGGALIKIGMQQFGPLREAESSSRRYDLIGSVSSIGLAWAVAWLMLQVS